MYGVGGVDDHLRSLKNASALASRPITVQSGQRLVLLSPRSYVVIATQAEVHPVIEQALAGSIPIDLASTFAQATSESPVDRVAPAIESGTFGLRLVYHLVSASTVSIIGIRHKETELLIQAYSFGTQLLPCYAIRSSAAVILAACLDDAWFLGLPFQPRDTAVPHALGCEAAWETGGPMEIAMFDWKSSLDSLIKHYASIPSLNADAQEPPES